jgi:hypothetical protein
MVCLGAVIFDAVAKGGEQALGDAVGVSVCRSSAIFCTTECLASPVVCSSPADNVQLHLNEREIKLLPINMHNMPAQLSIAFHLLKTNKDVEC